MTKTLTIPKDIYNEVLEESKRAYPNECCGVLLGTQASDGSSHKTVKAAVPTENINTERAADRFDIDPRKLLEIEKQASRDGLDVIGIYHSHPDHPDRPSEFDRERGWPEYSYMIISVIEGRVASVSSYSMPDMGAPFEKEHIKKVE